jgi:hypothetical protein
MLWGLWESVNGRNRIVAFMPLDTVLDRGIRDLRNLWFS